MKYFEELDYKVTSCEGDNLGWDLEADLHNIKLKLEVKGLSGYDINIELTPNEYQMMKCNKTVSRICIVSQAFATKPLLSIFAYNPDTSRWENTKGTY